jgi:hypothetical protein
VSDDKEQPFDRDMAEVDRLLKKLPTYDPVPVRRGQATPRGSTAGTSGSTLAEGGGGASWLRVGLGLALAAGMTVWPYSHVCGLKLFLYLGGVGTLVVTGVWGAWASWVQRRGLAHLLSLAVVLWGLVLAAGVTRPRVGYADTERLWFCPEPAAVAARPPPGP